MRSILAQLNQLRTEDSSLARFYSHASELKPPLIIVESQDGGAVATEGSLERQSANKPGAYALQRAAQPRLGEVIARLAAHPRKELLKKWNWKSALLSSAVRASLFFAVNLSAGKQAAIAAFLTELLYRSATSGFYGALTQNFSRVQPAWQGVLAAVVILPFANHALELLAHWARGTERLWLSLLASVCFTCISTAFHCFVMRRGLLTVGDGSQSLKADLAQMPKSVALFVASPFVWLYRLTRTSGDTLGESRPVTDA